MLANVLRKYLTLPQDSLHSPSSLFVAKTFGSICNVRKAFARRL